MEAEPTALSDVKLVKLHLFNDERGAFAETYDAEKFRKIGIQGRFVQDSWSFSRRAGTVRGLHFQAPPHPQAKLVRVTRGRIFDVVVDIRRGSPSFGAHVGIELSAAGPYSLFVPSGFAHGFCTLENDTEVTYKMSDHFVPALYKGIFWADPQLCINWPVAQQAALLSAQDAKQPLLAQIDTPFAWR